MSSKKKVVVFYEKDCWGETIATEAILSEWSKNKNVNVSYLKVDARREDSLFQFFCYYVKITIQTFLFFISSKPNSIDAIYCTSIPVGFACCLLKPFNKYSIIFHYHGNRIPDRPDNKIHTWKIFISQSIKYFYLLSIHHICFNTADHIVVPSIQAKKQLIVFLRSISMIKKIKIIPNGVDTKVFFLYSKNKKNVIRSKFNIPKRGKIILSIGRLEKQKHHLEILSLFQELKRSIKNKNLYLFFSYPTPVNRVQRYYLLCLKQVVKKNALSKNVIFLENFPPPLVYNIANLTISLSALETFSLTMLESLACGTPFLSSNKTALHFLKSIDERLIIEKNGSAASKVKNIIYSKDSEIKQLMNKSSQFLKNFSWRNTAYQIRELF